MKSYLPYIKKNWYCFVLAPFFMILEATGEFLLPYLNANIINNGAENGDIPYILKNGLYMALLAVGMLITGVLGANFAIRGASRLAAGIRTETFTKIQKFSFSDIDKFTTGSLITRITNDVTQVQSFTQLLLRGTFRSPVMLIGAIVMSFSLSPSLAKVILCVVPVLAILIFTIIKISSPRYTKMQEQLDLLNTDIGETVTNQRVIKSFVREEYEIEKFGKINSELVKKSINALKVMLFMAPVSSIAMNVTTLTIVWIAGRQIMIGNMAIGTLTAFTTYLAQILGSLQLVANIILQGTRAAASNRRIVEVLNWEVKLNDDNSDKKDLTVNDGAIEFKGVNFRYFKHNREMVLDNINFKINAGEFVGIIGPTGSGKSTIVSMIPRLYDCDSGEILVDNVNVKRYSLKNLRQSISVVLQKNTLFSGTIEENLRWGKQDATTEELENAVKISHAKEFIDSFKDGYQTELGQGGVNLSGGQKQRLCIARALLKKPKILILDDSTSAVDTKTDASIRRAFREEIPGVTKIVIAQRINSVIDADKIIVVDLGKIVGIGTHKELMKSCEIYREIYSSQKDLEEDLA